MDRVLRRSALPSPFSNSSFPATPAPMEAERRGKRAIKARATRAPKRAASSCPTVAVAVLEEAEAGGEAAGAAKDMEDFSPEEARKIRPSLLRWYDENCRVLPWRTASSSRGGGGGGGAGEEEVDEDRAYAVWVSEVMLQQTRVPTVIDYYNRWMERWPTLRQLASASQEEVNEMWAGLGYYRRARFLLEGAKSIVQQGEFPRTASVLCGVRGIGKYTAGAIASIAFNEVTPVVDGNVVRVISRLKAISANPKESATVKSFWKLAGQLVAPSRPGDFNQAMMELGATLCSTSSPSCSACPVSEECRALSLSRKNKAVKVTDYPTKVVKAKQRRDFAAVCVVEIADGLNQEGPKESNEKHVFLLVKRPEEGLLAGLWEFPSVLLDEGNIDPTTRRKSTDAYLKKTFDIDVGRNSNISLREYVGEYVHVFTHIRLLMYVELLVLTLKGGLDLLDNKEDQSTITWKCVDGNSMRSMGLTSGVRKVYSMIQDFKQKQLTQQPKVATKKKTKRSIHEQS